MEHRLYNSVLRDVLWGESREHIFQMLQTNGVFGHEAEELYRHARQERLSTLRREAFAQLTKGGGMLAGGFAVFIFFWFGLHFIPRIVAAGCLFFCIWGTWKIVDGIVNWFTVARTKGSVTTSLD